MGGLPRMSSALRRNPNGTRDVFPGAVAAIIVQDVPGLGSVTGGWGFPYPEGPIRPASNTDQVTGGL